jgi:hypothetical protein
MPLVRWCLKRGIRSSQVEEILRESFVHEAQQEIQNAQGAFSVSKLSVMTGLHRTEVSRLLAGERPDRGSHDILNRVLGLWASSTRYRTAEGVPRDLTHEGLSSEFARLVAEVSKEVTHYPILFELERIGAIEYVANLVRLKVQEYTPRQDHQYGLNLLSLDVVDLASAIEAGLGVALVVERMACSFPRLSLKPLKPEPEPVCIAAGVSATRRSDVILQVFVEELKRAAKESARRF